MASNESPQQRQQLPPDAPGFFPVSLAFNQTDAIGGVPASAQRSTFNSSTRDSRLDTSIASVGGASTGAGAAGEPNDADSDGYGQPSPRVTALSAAEEHSPEAAAGGAQDAALPHAAGGSADAPPSHFQAGYGEVPFPPGQRPRPSGAQDPWPEEQRAQHAGPARPVQANPTQAAPNPASARPAAPKLHFEIRVGDPQKVGDPMTAHIVYTVRTKTTATFFRAQSFSVLRRYNDFRWLHAALVANNPGTFVPPVPEKVKIGRFAPDLVEARRHGLEICINKIAAHPILQMDEDFKLFLESVNFSADVKLRDMRKGPVPTPEQRTYFGWQASLNGPKFHETDDWFDHQKAYLDSFEAQVKQVVKASSLLANQRRELAHAVSEYSLMLTNLSGSSLSRSMSTCFAGLAELEKRVQELNEVQSDADVRIIGSVMYEYERLVGSIRKAFTTRVDAWAAWYKSDEEARKVQAKHEKFKKDNRGTGGSHMEHRLQLSLQDVADAESRALTLKRDFDAVTARCKEEMSRFEREKVDDLRRALVRWLDGLIERQEEIVREWELYAALLMRQTGTNPDPDAPLPAPPASVAAEKKEDIKPAEEKENGAAKQDGVGSTPEGSKDAEKDEVHDAADGNDTAAESQDVAAKDGEATKSEEDETVEAEANGVPQAEQQPGPEPAGTEATIVEAIERADGEEPETAAQSDSPSQSADISQPREEIVAEPTKTESETIGNRATQDEPEVVEDEEAPTTDEVGITAETEEEEAEEQASRAVATESSTVEMAAPQEFSAPRQVDEETSVSAPEPAPYTQGADAQDEEHSARDAASSQDVGPS